MITGKTKGLALGMRAWVLGGEGRLMGIRADLQVAGLGVSACEKFQYYHQHPVEESCTARPMYPRLPRLLSQRGSKGWPATDHSYQGPLGAR